MIMTKVLTGVLSAGLLATGVGGAFAANNTIDQQEVENKNFTHSEVQDEKTPYSFKHKDGEIFSERALTQKELDQIKFDKTEPEQALGIPAESFNGTIHENEKTPYSYKHEDGEIFSERALTQEEQEQIKFDKTEPEQALGIPAESFNGTIHESK